MLDMLDVAIGVTFYFLLLSLITTAAGEVVEAVWKQRAKFLQRAIQGLLQDHDGTKLALAFYKHPLIEALYAGTPKWYKRNKANLHTTWSTPKAPADGGTPTPSVQDLPSRPTYIPAATFAEALLDLIKKQAGSPAGATLTAQLEASSLPGPLKDALGPLLADAGNDLALARRNVEEWYDAAMDRAAGWYKSHAQAIALAFGLFLAAFLNADTLYTVQALSREEGLRAAFVAAAQNAAEDAAAAREEAPPVETGEVQAPDTTGQPPLLADSAGSAQGREPDATDDPEEAMEAARAQLEANVERLEALGLPLGWDRNNPGAMWPTRLAVAEEKELRDYENSLPREGLSDDERRDSLSVFRTSLLSARPRAVPPTDWDTIRWWFAKLIGLLVTAVAVTLGAPFWFDVLNKFMVVRSTVKPKEKSPEEGSED